LSNSNEPVLVLTTKARMPSRPNTAGADLQYIVTVVARDDMYGELHKAFTSITDTQHSDVLPRLEFIDAVDADGDGRGELLFRQVSDAGRAFSIYRVIGDQLYPLFEGTPQCIAHVFDGGRRVLARLYVIKLSFADRGRLYLFHINPVGRIRTCVAGCAIASLGAVVASLLQTLQREKRQRLSADEVTNLFHGLICGDQLFFGRRVHPIKTRRNRRRTGDAHMNFFGSCVANHAHDLATGGAANDGVINQHDALAFEQAADRI